MIVFSDWNIAADDCTIGYQYDNKTRALAISGQLPEGFQWDLMVQSGSRFDVLHLEKMGEGIGVLLTRDQLCTAGSYYVQLRGSKGELVQHTNQLRFYVAESMSGDAHWPVIPSEFTQLEARVHADADRAEAALDKAPKVVDGHWYIYNAASGQYEDSGSEGSKGDTGPVGPQGPAGQDGAQGPKGDSGKTPVKGVDYDTPEDRAEIGAAVLAKTIAALGTVFDYKGSKLSKHDLPPDGNATGDVWFVENESVSYIWVDQDGGKWESFAPTVDLTGYATTKALTEGLGTKLDASKVGQADGTASLDSDGKVPGAQIAQATKTELGGVKAAPATSADTQAVRIKPDGTLVTAPGSGGGGSGAVDSINGQTGAVVLTAVDVGATTPEYVEQKDGETLNAAKDYADAKLVTIDVERRSDGSFWTKPETTGQQIIDLVNADKEVRLHFFDVVTGTGDQLYQYETTADSIPIFRRSAISSEKIERITLRVLHNGEVDFDLVPFKGGTLIVRTTQGVGTPALKQLTTKLIQQYAAVGKVTNWNSVEIPAAFLANMVIGQPVKLLVRDTDRARDLYLLGIVREVTATSCRIESVGAEDGLSQPYGDYATQTDLSDAIGALGTVFDYKGSKPSKSNLPVDGNAVGDVWYVVDESTGYVWIDQDGGKWESFGPTVDLTGYATTKALTERLAGKQDAGDYATNEALTQGLAGKQPVGDYATNPALSDRLDAKLDTSKVGQPDGAASLGADGKVPAAQLPAMDYIPLTPGTDGQFAVSDGAGGIRFATLRDLDKEAR